MLLSMTGYGRGVATYEHKSITVEVKSLNGKVTDLRLKVPAYYRDKELAIRNAILESVKRGKIDATIAIESDEGDAEFGLNKALFKKYYQEIQSMQGEMDLDLSQSVPGILRIPNVIQASNEALVDAEWNAVCEAVEQANNALYDYRREEGEALRIDFKKRIHSIRDHLATVEPLEAERITRLREKLSKHLEDFMGRENVDKNRFEQEVLFYLERLDITEEKVRLEQHCKYFLEVLDEAVELKGKKLSFISQEIGREINTLGSKAQFSPIQKIVVQMKDDLEKIKEQILNVV